MSKKEAITIEVTTDENKIPEKIEWSATDSESKKKEAKAMFLSLWDGENRETLKIDLWIKEMPINEMQLFFYQILVSMSDTFLKATQDEKMSATMKDFCDYYAEKLGLKK